jgi:hypothetical protein
MNYPRFQRAPGEVDKIASRIISKWHKELKEVKAKVDFCFCRAPTDEAGEPRGPALTKDGNPVAGIARVCSLKERAMGRADCEVSIDADGWDDWTPEQRDALIDHELHHFEPAKNPAGVYKRDDLGRPVLGMRKHDYTLGLFAVIAARHGAASFEVQAIRKLYERKDDGAQTFFPFLKELAEA